MACTVIRCRFGRACSLAWLIRLSIHSARSSCPKLLRYLCRWKHKCVASARSCMLCARPVYASPIFLGRQAIVPLTCKRNFPINSKKLPHLGLSVEIERAELIAQKKPVLASLWGCGTKICFLGVAGLSEARWNWRHPPPKSHTQGAPSTSVFRVRSIFAAPMTVCSFASPHLVLPPDLQPSGFSHLNYLAVHDESLREWSGDGFA